MDKYDTPIDMDKMDTLVMPFSRLKKQEEPSQPTKSQQDKETHQRTARHQFHKKHHVPTIHQMSIVECGAACLAMVLSYYGHKTTISDVRERCGVGRDGLSALSLVTSARKYGMRVRAVSLELNDFRFVTLPAIAHWEFNHFIVVERW